MSQRVTITIDGKSFRKYKLLAAKKGVSLSATMRCGLDWFMENVAIDEFDLDGVESHKQLVIVQGSKGQWGTKQTN